MKIIICDDELFARQQIKEAIQKYPSHYPLELYEFDSGEKILRELKEQHIFIWLLFFPLQSVQNYNVLYEKAVKIFRIFIYYSR